MFARAAEAASGPATRFGDASEVGDRDRNERTISATRFATNLYHAWSQEKNYPETEHDISAVPPDQLPERLKLFALQAGLLLKTVWFAPCSLALPLSTC